MSLGINWVGHSEDTSDQMTVGGERQYGKDDGKMTGR